MARSDRIAAREKFKWRGWEFKLSRADSKDAHWQAGDGHVVLRLLYRSGLPQDEFDPEIPPEYTALIRMHGIPAGEGVGASAELALAHAERDLRQKVMRALRFLSELRRGKLEDPST